mmetsp:Transcript_20711/g.45016  ORF Transcript_20711/g.45016 Transcript_20711/m.45016 type:complete len:212 (+) Transcript_20711:225-860(+)
MRAARGDEARQAEDSPPRRGQGHRRRICVDARREQQGVDRGAVRAVRRQAAAVAHLHRAPLHRAARHRAAHRAARQGGRAPAGRHWQRGRRQRPCGRRCSRRRAHGDGHQAINAPLPPRTAWHALSSETAEPTAAAMALPQRARSTTSLRQRTFADRLFRAPLYANWTASRQRGHLVVTAAVCSTSTFRLDAPLCCPRISCRVRSIAWHPC